MVKVPDFFVLVRVVCACIDYVELRICWSWLTIDGLLVEFKVLYDAIGVLFHKSLVDVKHCGQASTSGTNKHHRE